MFTYWTSWTSLVDLSLYLTLITRERHQTKLTTNKLTNNQATTPYTINIHNYETRNYQSTRLSPLFTPCLLVVVHRVRWRRLSLCSIVLRGLWNGCQDQFWIHRRNQIHHTSTPHLGSGTLSYAFFVFSPLVLYFFSVRNCLVRFNRFVFIRTLHGPVVPDLHVLYHRFLSFYWVGS